MSAPMEIFFFHLMPWPQIPENVTQKYGSSWVVLPNSYYEPQLGHELYNQYLDQLEYADQLGFDALCVNEHHQNGYGLMPSPNIMAATLARRTKNAKIAILGNGVNLRENPLRVAEEVAMLDVISGGRILSGFVRGIGAEYYSLNLDPSQSRSRFHEAHDLIIKAWTEPGPFEWDGEHFRFRYVNVWPRVFQKPHPPIFSPSQGSSETIRWAAQHGYPYICTYAPIDQLVHYYTLYRQIAAEEYGYAAGPEKFGWTSMVYVAKDEKTAVEEARAHIEYFNKRCFALPPQMLVPPGYTSPDSFRNMVQARMARPTQFDYDEMIATGQALIGTPEQVGERLLRNMERAGTGIFMGAFQVGDMPHAKVMKNLELFAKEVLPHLPRTKHDYRAKPPLPARAAG
ncbi:MAG: LLM class flavin-dependent oxidoreductase [Pseudomonadota bacterium]|jgi:alkanesulfonate monooxygenase SsuD/methylene tetrahydromethanopterin reductase-like flavin-dependent oxidoreductase (luciferase family)|nr:LLM class flavin-dependent oxidoreductase [Alphaproteobacteria bacterium]